MAADNKVKEKKVDLFFDGVVGLIVEQGLGKGRKRILEKQLEGKGGTVASTFSQSVTHIIVGPNMKFKRLTSLLKLKDPLPGITIVTADWLSSSLIAGKMVDSTSYHIPREESMPPQVKKVSDFSSSVPVSPSPPPPAVPTKQHVMLVWYGNMMY